MNYNTEDQHPLDIDGMIHDILAHEQRKYGLKDIENRRIELEHMEDWELELLHESVRYWILADVLTPPDDYDPYDYGHYKM